MTVTMSFDGHEERHEMLQAVHAVDYMVALDEVEQMLRRHWKYNDALTEEQHEIIDQVWAEWCDIRAGLPEFA